MNPNIIQGGMGVGVSNWRLARTVSALGQLGVVSGTALEQVLLRRLQDGDPGTHMRRGLAHFPVRRIASEILGEYYIAGGKRPEDPYRKIPTYTKDGPRSLRELTLAANFVEVFLAREGHDNPVGINYLEKIQLPHLPALYGAMLAGVSYVLMGAGIPSRIPGVLDSLARHEPATYPLTVTGSLPLDDTTLEFVPAEFLDPPRAPLKRPKFLAIIASDVLAEVLVRKASGRVDGLVVEGPSAGGHNAPPRGRLQLNPAGEPIYGERDRVDLKRIRDLGLPFWLAGGYGRVNGVRDAVSEGAAGIQVGTAFALCAESGLAPEYRARLLARVRAGTAGVFTDPIASPTGFPFKVAELEGTLSSPAVYLARPRICDLGYLREAFRTPDGAVDFRCPAEPVSLYVAKGGRRESTAGRMCVCNALIASIGHPQVRGGRYVEPPLITAGDDLAGVARFLRPNALDYTAADVIDTLLNLPVSERA